MELFKLENDKIGNSASSPIKGKVMQWAGRIFGAADFSFLFQRESHFSLVFR